jgi:ectoine hydroxylase-related dioxygenase (phytanoyl-CoA dioxygenase family)
LDQNQLARLNAEIQPHLDATEPDAANDFMGSRTKRFGRLLYRLPMARELTLNPSVLAAADEILLPYSPRYRVHFTGVMHVMGGQTAQRMHCDLSPFASPSPTVVLATMWAATDFTRDNGATVLAPGSHKWSGGRAPTPDELISAEMPAGSVLLYAGNIVHGAGASTGGFRTGVNIQYAVGWMRQEENQYLAVPQNIAAAFPAELQRIMGYDLTARHWGYVDQIHPFNFINGNMENGGLAPDGMPSIGQVAELYMTVKEGTLDTDDEKV